MSGQKGEFPPRVFLSIAVDGDFNPYVRIQSDGDLRNWFGDPMHGKTKPGQWYVPESLIEQARREAEAKAYRRAAKHARAYWGDNVSDTLLAWAKECEGESE